MVDVVVYVFWGFGCFLSFLGFGGVHHHILISLGFVGFGGVVVLEGRLFVVE